MRSLNSDAISVSQPLVSPKPGCIIKPPSPYYKDAMFPFMEIHESVEQVAGSPIQEKVKETYVLRPMNCPHHHRIFASKLRSYRELPLRLAEYGNVFRFEDSGSVSGLLRVRGMCMNDAHIYCTEDQIEEEFLKVMRMHAHLYDLLGLKNYYMRHSTWDPEDPKGQEKFVNDPAAWEFTQDRVRRAMDKSGLPYKEVKGEAAFMELVDFQMSTVTGRKKPFHQSTRFCRAGAFGLSMCR